MPFLLDLLAAIVYQQCEQKLSLQEREGRIITFRKEQLTGLWNSFKLTRVIKGSPKDSGNNESLQEEETL